MRRPRPGLLLLALLAMALAPAADASPGTMGLMGRLPVEASGDVRVAGQDAHLFAFGDAGQLALALEDVRGEAVHVVHRSFELASHTETRVEERPLVLAGASLRLVDRGAGFAALAYGATAELATPGAGNLTVDALAEPWLVHLERDLGSGFSVHWDTPSGGDGAFRHAIPATGLRAEATAGRLAADGPFHLLLTGGRVALAEPGRPVELLDLGAREAELPGGVYNPADGTWVGPGTHTEALDGHILVRVDSGRLAAAFAGLPASLHAERLLLAGTGALNVPHARGVVTVAAQDRNATFTPAFQDLALDGSYEVVLERAEAAGWLRATGSGDLAAVRYGPVSASFTWEVAAAGLGALLAGALAWALAKGKLAGWAGALAGYARVHGERLLLHPRRLEAYKAVQAQPGISLSALARRLGVSASTLRHHLRALVRNGDLACLRDGRERRYFDARSPAYAGPRRQAAASALLNPNTAAVAGHVRGHPGASQKDLVRGLGMAQGTVRWHLGRLRAAGLVEEVRDPPFVRYFPAGARDGQASPQE